MLSFQAICIDAQDPVALGTWWRDVLDWRYSCDDDGDVVLEPRETSITDTGQPDILFLKVPEAKAVKNRLHIDLRPDDQAVEVARLEALGAVRVEIGQSDNPASTWVVLADPEGNEFCVLRASDQTRTDQARS